MGIHPTAIAFDLNPASGMAHLFVLNERGTYDRGRAGDFPGIRQYEGLPVGHYDDASGTWRKRA